MGDWRPSKIRSSATDFRLPSRTVFHGHVQSVVHEIEINPVVPTRKREVSCNHAHAADRSDQQEASRGIGRGIALKLAEQGVKELQSTTRRTTRRRDALASQKRGAAPLVIQGGYRKVCGHPAHVRDHHPNSAA